MINSNSLQNSKYVTFNEGFSQRRVRIRSRSIQNARVVTCVKKRVMINPERYGGHLNAEERI